MNGKLHQSATEAEERITYLTEKEKKTTDRARHLSHEHDLLRAEMKNLLLKTQVLERKAEEATVVENALLGLQRDYNELVKEKAAVIQGYENKIFYLKDEGKEAKGAVTSNQKVILKVQREAEEWQREFHTLNREMTRLKKANEELFRESSQKDRQLEERSRKEEAYVAELGSVTHKIIDFEALMEKLIHENQQLNIMVQEGAKAAHLTPLERKVLDRAKMGAFEKDGTLKMSSTIKNFRAEPTF